MTTRILAVAEKFIGHKKLDIGSYDAIFKAYESKDPDALSEIASYCAIDAVLPLMLCNHFNAITEDLSLCVETRLPPYRVAQGGMTARLMGRIAWECQQAGVALNKLSVCYESYQGARVLPPKPGYYGNNPVAVLDFASLYPSIMRAHNLSPDSFVMPEHVEMCENAGVPMTCIDVKSEEKGKEHETMRMHHFVKSSVLNGFIPSIAAHLLQMRSDVKKSMKKEKAVRRA